MSDLHEVQKTVLRALVQAPDGQLTIGQLRQLYHGQGDGVRVNWLIRHGLADWMRKTDIGAAYAIRITEDGRALAAVITPAEDK